MKQTTIPPATCFYLIYGRWVLQTLIEGGEYEKAAFDRDEEAMVAEIDARTGEPTIYAEKEVVEKVIPNMTKTARKTYDELQAEIKKVKKTDIKKYRFSLLS